MLAQATSLVEVFLHKRIFVNVVNSIGETELHYCTFHAGSTQVKSENIHRESKDLPGYLEIS